MTTTYTEYKTCTECDQSKPVSSFYKRSGRDDYLTYCKQCYKKRASKQERLSQHEPGVESEKLAIQYLWKNRIPALPGKTLGYADTDVVVHGIVRVEIKLGIWKHVGSGSSHFIFMTSPQQRERGFLADVVMLICPWEDNEPTFHIFEVDNLVFYNEETERIKTGIYYRPGAIKPGKSWVSEDYYLSEGKMQDAQDNLVLIYDALGRLASELPEKANDL